MATCKFWLRETNVSLQVYVYVCTHCLIFPVFPVTAVTLLYTPFSVHHLVNAEGSVTP